MGAPCQKPDPKSGCSPVSSPMLAISAPEFGSTGRADTSWFQGLSAGKASAPYSGAPRPSAAREKLPKLRMVAGSLPNTW